MNFFTELLTRTDDARRSFEAHPAVQEVVAHGMSLPCYQAFLLELYPVVRHFNPVCAVAASRLGDGEGFVRDFLYDHLVEEKGHDVWVLQDLQAMGVETVTARAHRPLVPTLCLTGYNHWAADRGHPGSVLGMLFALEVIASVYAGPFVAALRERLFLDGERGVSFLASHASLDAEHLETLRHVLARLEDASARDAVVESVRVNFHQFTQVVEAVMGVAR